MLLKKAPSAVRSEEKPLTSNKMATQWKEYLTRPYDLLGTSLWVQWYASPQIKKVVGTTLTKARCIELPTKSVVQYRDDCELARFENAIRRITEKSPEKVLAILRQAQRVNRRAIAVLNKENPTRSLNEEIRFLTDLGVFATVLPFFIGRYLPEHRTRERSQLLALRTHSYYLQYQQKVIHPLAKVFIRSRGYPSIIAGDCTAYELLSGSFDGAIRRHALRLKGRLFAYTFHNHEETVRMVKYKTPEVRSIHTTIIHGLTAYPGVMRGLVRIVHTRSDARGISAKHVLVAPSTNPNLAPFMKKVAAIVTDEGGMISHAAIIARELKKPCIVGTKNATKILKDGDRVEVDASHGFVKKLP